jgi:hypothetical protein
VDEGLKKLLLKGRKTSSEGKGEKELKITPVFLNSSLNG